MNSLLRSARGIVADGMLPDMEQIIMTNGTVTVKEQARQLIERLSDDATWEDVQYEIYVLQAVEAGLKDSREGRTVSHEDVRRRFGLEPA